jgi:hypothetical protein
MPLAIPSWEGLGVGYASCHPPKESAPARVYLVGARVVISSGLEKRLGETTIRRECCVGTHPSCKPGRDRDSQFFVR